MKARLAIIGLGALVAAIIVLVAGAVLWDRVLYPQRPVARVDGQAISLQQYTDVLSYRRSLLQNEQAQALQMAQMPAPAGTDPSQNVMAVYARQELQRIQGQLAALETQTLDALIEDHLIRDEARRRNITVSEEDIQQQLKLLVGYDGAAEVSAGTSGSATGREELALRSRLREYRRITGATDALIRSHIESQLLRQALASQLGAQVPAAAEQVRARHILVRDEATARTVLDRLRAGEGFAGLAAEFSIDPATNQSGGEIGWFGRGALVSAFEEAAFSLPVGQVSEPVRTNFGYHIIVVDERAAARDLEGESLRVAREAALPKWLEQQKQQHQIERLLDDDMIDWALRNGHQPAALPRGERRG